MNWAYGLLGILLALPGAASASNTLIAPGRAVAVARSPLTVTPDREWNRIGARQGEHAEHWTIDGLGLNDLDFFGGIAEGRSLLGKIPKRARPVPLFNATMLITDIPAFYENTYRVLANFSVIT